MSDYRWIIINTLTGEAAKLDQLGEFVQWTSDDLATSFATRDAAEYICGWMEHQGMRNIDYDRVKVTLN